MKTPVDHQPTSSEVQGKRCNPDDTNVEPSYSFLNEVVRHWPVIDEQPGALPEQTLWINRYRTRQILGQGGFGVVYLAEDITLHRLVALKIARPEVLAKPEWRKRFQREAITAASLDHPNIVPVFDAGEKDGIGYITCAYCPGIDLGRWLTQRPIPVPPIEAAAFLRKIALAVAYLHARSLVHHDLKPANILLTQEGVSQIEEQAVIIPLNLMQAHPRLTDFGLAQFVSLTREQLVGGTPTYMAPEQSRSGHQVGPTADVFALGAILYELLTAKPYRNTSTVLNDIQVSLGHDPLQDEACRDIPGKLLAIVQKCVATNPSDRYADAGQFVDALDDFLKGSGAYRAMKTEHGRPSSRERWINWSIMFVMFFVILWFSWGRDIWNSTALKQTIFDPVQYANVVKQASDAWSRQEDMVALEMLNRYASPVMVPHRDFTWGMLYHQLAREIKPCLRRQPGHQHQIRSMTLSPDRQWMLTTDSSGDCIITSLTDNKATLRFNCGKTPRTALLSPDNKTFVVLCDGTPDKPASSLQWRDRTSGELWKESFAQRWVYTAAVFTPDGKYLAVASHTIVGLTEGTVELWDVQKRTVVATLTSRQAGHGILGGLAISPDGQRLYVGTTEPAIEVWDLPQRKLITTLVELKQAVCQLAVSPDGKFLASVSCMNVSPASDVRDRRIVVWDTVRLQQQCIIPGPSEGYSTTVAFNPLTPEFLLICSLQGQLECWNVVSNQLCTRHQAPGMLSFFAAWKADSACVLVTSTTNELFEWSPVCLADMNTRIREIWGLAVSPDGQTLAVAADDANNANQHCLFLLDARTASQIKSSSQAHDATISKVLYSNDGRALFTTGLDQAIKRWDASTMLVTWTASGHNYRGIRSAALSHDDKTLATSGLDSTVICWDAASGKELTRVHFEVGTSSIALAFHPHKPWLAMAGAQRFQVWDYQRKEIIFTADQLGYLACLLFDAAGDRLYLGGPQPIIHVWNTESRTFQGTLTTTTSAALALSPDQKTLVASSMQGTLKFWYVPTGQELATITTPALRLEALTFHPNGQILYAASRESHLFLWHNPK